MPHPCVSKGALRRSLGTPREQLAELSSAPAGRQAGGQAAGNPVHPEPGQALLSAGGTAEAPTGTAEPLPGVSALSRPHTAVGTGPSTLRTCA